MYNAMNMAVVQQEKKKKKKSDNLNQKLSSWGVGFTWMYVSKYLKYIKYTHRRVHVCI